MPSFPFTWFNLADSAIGELNAAVDASVTSFVLKSGHGIKFPASDFIFRCEQEWVHCATRSTDTLSSLTRGYDGTTAATHVASATVFQSAGRTLFERLYDNLNAHTHPKADITDFSHNHAQGDVTNLVSDLAGKAAASHPHAQSDVTNLTTDLAAKEATANKGAANGYASLDSGGKVPSAQLPASGGGDVVYVPTAGDTAVNVTADATIVTRDVTGVAAGDQVLVEGWFTILNNSTATRVYVVTLDFDGLFDVEMSTGACAFSATLMHPFIVRAICNVRSTSLAYAMAHLQGQLAAGIASGTDTTVAATHLAAMGWGTSASNATGTLTVALKVRSANATATQTLRLHSFQIRKVTPT